MLSDAFRFEGLSPEREKIVECGRSYLDVKWRHQGRSRAAGVDCAGLLICVGRDVDLLDRGFDITGYRRTPDGRTLMEALQAHAEQKGFDDLRPGDFVLMRGLDVQWPTHMGILSEVQGQPYLIHAWMQPDKVVETAFSGSWYDCAVGIFKLRGVPD